METSKNNEATTPSLREWEKEFDSKFGAFMVECFHYDTGASIAPTVEAIKIFIRDLLSQTRAEEIERVVANVKI